MTASPTMDAADPDRIMRIAAKGDGVTADSRYAALAAPGDRLRGDGVLEPGPHRQTAPCRHFPRCGGCQLQHVDDAGLADFVRDRVVGALAAQGVVAGDVRPAHLSLPRTRRRAGLRALKGGRQVAIGFSEAGSNRIVDMHQCELLHPALFALIAPLRTLLTRLLGDRKLAEVKLQLVDQGVEVMVSGVRADGLDAAMAIQDFAAVHALARLVVDSGGGPETLWEPEPATVSLSGIPVAVPPHAFLQATAEGEAALVAAVREAVGDARTVADLFSGVGTFALALVEGRKVYAAEAGRDAVLALSGAAQRRQLPVVTEHRDLYRRPLVPAELNRFGAVIIDPPRAGAEAQVEQIAASAVPHVAYVSCNPASFARDATMLAGAGYALDWVQPVGQFRWSTHVELAGAFRLIR